MNKSFQQSLYINLFLIIALIFQSCLDKKTHYSIRKDARICVTYPMRCSCFYDIDCSNNEVIIQYIGKYNYYDTIKIKDIFCDSLFIDIVNIKNKGDSFSSGAIDGLSFYILYKEQGETHLIKFDDLSPDMDISGLKQRNSDAYKLYLKMESLIPNNNCIPPFSTRKKNK